MDPRSDLNRLALPWLLVLAGAYYLGALLGTGLLTLHPANITLLWLPAGAGLIMAMGGGWRALPLIALASFAVRGPPLLADGMGPSPWLHAAVAALGDGLVPCLAARAFLGGPGVSGRSPSMSACCRRWWGRASPPSTSWPRAISSPPAPRGSPPTGCWPRCSVFSWCGPSISCGGNPRPGGSPPGAGSWPPSP